MQDPGTFLVVVAVEQIEQLRRRTIDDWPLGVLTAEDLVGLCVHVGAEGAVTIGMPAPERSQVGGKSLGQPQVMPVGLGHRVTKPLVRRLMSHNRLAHVSGTVT